MAKINSRAKGANGELEVAVILQRVVNKVAIKCGYQAPTIRRNVEQCQVGGEDLLGLPWYSIEVKRCERVELDKWWEQTCIQARRKAPGANAWDVLVKGGWKRVGSEAVGTGQVATGDGPGAAVGASPVREEAAGGLRVMGGGSVGLAGGEAACTDEGSGLARFAAGGLQRAAQGGLDAGEAAGLGMPAPTWSRPQGGQGGQGLAALFPSRCGTDRSKGGPVPAGVSLVGQCEAKSPVSRPVVGFEQVAPCPTPSQGPNAKKQVSMAREPVLIWRTNGKPWNVRFLGTLATHNGFRLASVVDASLETWLEVLREDLGFRLRG